MIKMKNLFTENMRRFNTKNINEDRFIHPKSDDMIYDTILNLIEKISTQLDAESIRATIEDQSAGANDNGYYDTIMFKIIPMIKELTQDIQEDVNQNVV
jgi:hypothetical protein